MQVVKQPNMEPIPGYRLIEPLGQGGYGEVWKCEAPGGLFKAIKFVHGNLNDLEDVHAQEELRAVEHIKTIRHPFLLQMDRVECVQGELMIVMELADQNLAEILQRCQGQGLPGIPRDALLGYLREAAEVLDLMDCQYELQHLDIKPGNLFVVSNHVKVADFGLVNSLKAVGKSPQIGAITPLYAAPELFQGSLSRRCDQYSLAVVFQELLTGALPFAGLNTRQLLVQHTKAEPDLRLLPVSDRPVVARALSKEPGERFDSCMAFIEALETSSSAITVPVWGTHRRVRSAQETAPVRPHKTLGPIPTPAAGSYDEIAGHQFHDCLGSSPLMDVWRGQGPDGRPRLLKFLYGFCGRGNANDQQALTKLNALQHPALLPVQVLQVDKGRLVVASDFLEETLRDRLHQCQALGLPGIPRDELLGYLGPVAEALDALQQGFDVQHLMLNPRTVLLDKGKPQISDFGLAQLLWLPAGQPAAERNARYSAPELLEGRLSRRCDQYSLALMYHELLTGSLPKREPRGQRKPALDLLPGADRAVIGRALEPDPTRRFAGNAELIRALKSPRKSSRAVPAGAPQVTEPPFGEPPATAEAPAARGAVVCCASSACRCRRMPPG
jgi:serine/threonine protein kinase